MNRFVISDGTAIRLSDVTAVHTDEHGRHIAFLENGLWIEISHEMYRKLMAVLFESRAHREAQVPHAPRTEMNS